MRILRLLLALLCFGFASCERSPKYRLGGIGDDPTWISTHATRQIGEQLITNRYPYAQIVEELGNGQKFTYRFVTNGTVVPVSVIVDRKTGVARFVTSSR